MSSDNVTDCNFSYDYWVHFNETTTGFPLVWYQTWESLMGICIFVVIINLYFLLAACLALKHKSLHKKRYFLLINLSISDVITNGCMAGVGFVSKDFSRRVNGSVSYTTSTLPALGCFIYVITYIALNLFQFIAIKNPLYYRSKITLKHCCFIIAGTWIFSIGLFTATAIGLNTSYITMNAMTVVIETSSWINIVVCALVIGTFLLSVSALPDFKLWKNSNHLAAQRRGRILMKLGVHVLVFVLCLMPGTIYGLYYANKIYPAYIRALSNPVCDSAVILDFLTSTRTQLLVTSSWFLRSAFDIILHFVFEPTLKRWPWQLCSASTKVEHNSAAPKTCETSA